MNYLRGCYEASERDMDLCALAASSGLTENLFLVMAFAMR